MPKRILKTLSETEDGSKNSELKKEKPKTERDVIENMLYKKSDFLWRRAIVWDILSYTTKEWEEEKGSVPWEEKQIVQEDEKEKTQFRCKYWLWITVNNLSSFLSFCGIHGFIPLVDKIYIEWQDVSKMSSLDTLFSPIIEDVSKINPQITEMSWNETKKLDKRFQRSSQRVLDSLKKIYDYNTKTYTYLMWENLEKLDDNNIWAFSENIFAEIAIRLENQIRDKIWIESSYIFLAWYDNDNKEKTDMHFVIKKTPSQSPRPIPMQFTTWKTRYQISKEKEIEDYLIKTINEEDNNEKNKIRNFILLTVNGEFAKHITHHVNSSKETWQMSKQFTIINEDYKDWINNPQEREKYNGSKFPLFSYRIDPNIIEPAEIIYIALHMLYKQHSFRYTTKETYLNSFKENTEIEKRNPFEINGIKLSDISIGECSIEEIHEDSNFWPSPLLKHKFQICYQWKHVWVIVIYEAKQEKSN